MKKSILKMKLTASLMLLAISPGFAQSNLGEDCGCPPVSSRTTINLSTLAVSGGATDGELTASNTILTCDKIYILDKKIYVPNGKSITINPGTLLKGNPNPGGDPAQAVALVVERGGKIFASGTPTCQIVFTSVSDPMNGTYGVNHHGDWGGVVLLGKAKNNLTAANATAAFGGTCSGASCFGTGPGTGYVEGFTAADARNQYGAAPGSEDDNDNSGILKYVSIRFAGAVINANGNELNGLTLGSVGRGTTIENVEIIASNDDGIEFFGGTVNLKYIACMWGMDDMFDWDQGWTGKAQFIFGLAGDSVTCPSSDNGIEADGDDQKTSAATLSHPKIYNMTLIGNGHRNQNQFDNSAHAGINAKELTEGEIYSSIFANWETGFNMQKAPGTRASAIEAWNKWTSAALRVECNTFVGNAEGLKLDKSKTSDGVAPAGSDNTKFTTTDLNVVTASVPGFDFLFTMNTSTNVVSDKYDAVPDPLLSSTCAPPVDGFFTVTNFRGAFQPGKKSWLADWSYIAQFAGAPTNSSITPGLVPCITDIDGNGLIDNVDFLLLLGDFDETCP